MSYRGDLIVESNKLQTKLSKHGMAVESNTVQRLREEIRLIESKLATAQEELATVKAERDALKSKYNNLDKGHRSLQRTFTIIQGELKSVKAERDALKSRIENAPRGVSKTNHGGMVGVYCADIRLKYESEYALIELTDEEA